MNISPKSELFFYPYEINNKLIDSKRQLPNLKKLLNKTEFGNEEVGVRKIYDANVASHCYYQKNMHLKM